MPGYDPRAQAEGCCFDAAAAQTAIDFFPSCLKHIEGEMAGRPFELQPWQQAFVGCLFGWKRQDGQGRAVRRYREALLYVPRKNGKTPLVAGLALYVFFCDPETGQQDYIAAGEREQAGMLFRQAKGMVEQEPELSRRCKAYGGNASAGQSRSLVREQDGSFLRVISADAQGKHGGNTHLAVIDELHVQPNRDLVDVLTTSMASQNRRQPLLIHITTADFVRPSICNEKYDYACKVRDNVIRDPSFLPMIYEAGVADDWTSPAAWAKANPNLGVSVSREYLERECQRAKDTPSYENTFRRLHLNVRTEQAERWLPMEAWDQCGGQVDAEALAGRECYSGLDLSSRIDLTAHVLVFPPRAGERDWHLLCRFWMPKETARARERQDRVPYGAWAAQGWITLTEGNVVDYRTVQASVLEDARTFDLRQVGYDPWNASSVAQQLQEDGAAMVEYRQNFAAMNEPAKELEKLVTSGRLAHGGNPVLRWMASNVARREDPAGNIRPDKAASTGRIDGIVGAVMGLGLALAREEGGSVYDGRGVEAL